MRARREYTRTRHDTTHASIYGVLLRYISTQVVAGVELFLQKAEEWESYASRDVSIKQVCADTCSSVFAHFISYVCMRTSCSLNAQIDAFGRVHAA